MINYPDNLPLPLVRSYSVRDSQEFVRDDLSVGPISFALDSIDTYSEVSVVFSLDGQEKDAFTYFVDVTLLNRSRSMIIDLELDGVTQSVECYIESLSYSSVGKRWNATATLTTARISSDSGGELPVYTPIETASHVWNMNTGIPTTLVDEGTSSLEIELIFSGDTNVLQPSMRADATGNSIEFPVQGALANSWLYNYTDAISLASHFTLEAIFKFDAEQVVGSDRSCIGIYTPENAQNGGYLCLTADNFNTGSGTSSFPVITLRTEGQYNQSSQNGVVVAEARSSTAVVLGNIYHLLATFNALTQTLYLYVNGVLADEVTLSNSEYATWLGSGESDITDGARVNRKTLRIGKRPVASTVDAQAQAGRVDNALFHNGVFMPAPQAAQQATIAAYT